MVSRGGSSSARFGTVRGPVRPVGAATWQRVVVFVVAFCGVREVSGAAPGWWGITVVVHDRARAGR